jgi:hypothetical protein
VVRFARIFGDQPIRQRSAKARNFIVKGVPQ